MVFTDTISKEYQDACQNPWPGALSESFKEGVFEGNQDSIDANTAPLLGRRVANYLSNLPVSIDSSKRSYDELGPITNVISHIVNAALLRKEGDEKTKNYCEKVEKLAESIFRPKKDEKPFLTKELSFALQEIDVPNSIFSKSIPVELNSDQSELIEKLMAKFELAIVKRHDRLGGVSLRAFANEKDNQILIDTVKKSVENSRYFDQTDKEKFTWFKEAFTALLEGRDIHQWVLSEAKSYHFSSEELKELQAISSEKLQERAIEILSQSVLNRMEDYIQNNPQIQLSPRELAAFLIQDFYPCIAGVKHVVDESPINAARQEICPGIADVQYPRVTYMRIPLSSINPFSVECSTLQHALSIAWEESGDLHVRDAYNYIRSINVGS